jgi:DNA-binding NtrC family response regulator
LRDAGVPRASITAPAGRALFAASLPGNVRQLRTVLRSAAILAADTPIDLHHLGPLSSDPDPDADPVPVPVPVPVPESSARLSPTAEDITAALEAAGGNVVRAAAALGAHPRQLYRWIERFGVDLARYRG